MTVQLTQDDGGEITKGRFAAWFAAVSDQNATRQIEAKYPNLKCEVWQGSRLVASIFPKRSGSIYVVAT